MWRQKLLQSILKLSFYIALFIAVPVAPMAFKTWPLKHSRSYTIYCAIIHLGYLAIIPSTYTNYFYERSYMSGLPVLQLVYSFMNASRIFAIISFIAGYWLRRASLIAWYHSIEDFCWCYRHRLRGTMANSMQTKQKVELVLLVKYCSTSANVLLHSFIIFKVYSNDDIASFHTTAISILLTLFLGAILDQFCNILTKLRMHFECVNQSLRSVILQLKALNHALSLGASEMGVRHRARSLQRHLVELNGMHFQCFRLAQRCIKIWELTAASLTLKIVVNNIYNLYHMVLFRNKSLKLDSLIYLNGFLLTVTSFMDTTQLNYILVSLLKAGNKPGLLLHECGDLLQLRRCVTTKLMQSLDQFSLQLTCRHLSYNICGMFNLDWQMGLKCLVASIVLVTVLMQYDLKSKIALK